MQEQRISAVLLWEEGALIMLSAERYWRISCLMLWRYLVLFHVFSSADLLPVMSWERESLKVRRRGTGKKNLSDSNLKDYFMCGF